VRTPLDAFVLKEATPRFGSKRHSRPEARSRLNAEILPLWPYLMRFVPVTCDR
jgi:hypothetical protein